MSYPLTRAQKTILSNHGIDFTEFDGDDNDASILFGHLSLVLFIADDVKSAWEVYQHDPGAVWGATFDAWNSAMKTRAIQELKEQLASFQTKEN